MLLLASESFLIDAAYAAVWHANNFSSKMRAVFIRK
jgi:hypothetical protein